MMSTKRGRGAFSATFSHLYAFPTSRLMLVSRHSQLGQYTYLLHLAHKIPNQTCPLLRSSNGRVSVQLRSSANRRNSSFNLSFFSSSQYSQSCYTGLTMLLIVTVTPTVQHGRATEYIARYVTLPCLTNHALPKPQIQTH